MASKMDSSEGKVSSSQSCELYECVAHMGSKARSTSSVCKEEIFGLAVASCIA
jgi:hypothetical protein